MKSRSSISGPLVLIVVGVIFLIHAISPDFRLGDLLAHYWPYGLILWGVISLAEVCVRFAANSALPTNGVSGGGWLLAVFVVIMGSSAYEFQRPGNWLRQVGFDSGMEAFGQEREYPIAEIHKTISVQPHVVFEDFRGDAKVVGMDAETISVKGQKVIRAFDGRDADTANSQTPVEIVTEGNTVIVRCHQERATARSSVTSNLEVSIPKGASVEIAASHGTVDVSSLDGSVDITGANGSDVKVQDIGGPVKLDTRGADSIRCVNLKQSLALRGRGTDVDLEKILGQVIVAGNYTGTVSVREVAQPVRVESMRTQFDAQKITGFVRLNRGSFEGENVVGPVKLTAHSTDVKLAGFAQSLDLNVDRGDIELQPERSAMGRITVHTRSGDIELAVPTAAHFALTAKTDSGEIDNQFGEALKESSQGRGSHLEGAVGSGPDVSLITQHGSITVKKAGAETASDGPASKDIRDAMKEVHKELKDTQNEVEKELRER